MRIREGDIPVLAGYLLEKVRHQFNTPNLHVHPRLLSQLESLPWYGNVRELEHALTRAALHAIQQAHTTINIDHFDILPHRSDVKTTSSFFPLHPKSMRELVEVYQKLLIEHALRQSDGVWSKAADFLHMDRGNLYRMGKKLGVSSK